MLAKAWTRGIRDFHKPAVAVFEIRLLQANTNGQHLIPIKLRGFGPSLISVLVTPFVHDIVWCKSGREESANGQQDWCSHCKIPVYVNLATTERSGSKWESGMAGLSSYQSLFAA
jgi:hypothetical protein